MAPVTPISSLQVTDRHGVDESVSVPISTTIADSYLPVSMPQQKTQQQPRYLPTNDAGEDATPVSVTLAGAAAALSAHQHTTDSPVIEIKPINPTDTPSSLTQKQQKTTPPPPITTTKLTTTVSPVSNTMQPRHPQPSTNNTMSRVPTVTKSSRRPTEELKELDEGYGSMPIMEDGGKAKPNTSTTSGVDATVSVTTTTTGVDTNTVPQSQPISTNVSKPSPPNSLNTDTITKEVKIHDTDRLASIDEQTSSVDLSHVVISPRVSETKPPILYPVSDSLLHPVYKTCRDTSLTSISTEYVAMPTTCGVGNDDNRDVGGVNPLRKWAPVNDLFTSTNREALARSLLGETDDDNDDNNVLTNGVKSTGGWSKPAYTGISAKPSDRFASIDDKSDDDDDDEDGPDTSSTREHRIKGLDLSSWKAKKIVMEALETDTNNTSSNHNTKTNGATFDMTTSPVIHNVIEGWEKHAMAKKMKQGMDGDRIGSVHLQAYGMVSPMMSSRVYTGDKVSPTAMGSGSFGIAPYPKTSLTPIAGSEFGSNSSPDSIHSSIATASTKSPASSTSSKLTASVASSTSSSISGIGRVMPSRDVSSTQAGVRGVGTRFGASAWTTPSPSPSTDTPTPTKTTTPAPTPSSSSQSSRIEPVSFIPKPRSWFRPRDIPIPPLLKRLYNGVGYTPVKDTESVVVPSTSVSTNQLVMDRPQQNLNQQNVNQHVKQHPYAAMPTTTTQHTKKSPQLLRRFMTQKEKTQVAEQKPVVGERPVTGGDVSTQSMGVNGETSSTQQNQQQQQQSKHSTDDDDLLLEYHARKEKTRFDATYKIIRQIGSGGHSTVRLATRVSDNKQVVCKFIHASSVWHWHTEKETSSAGGLRGVPAVTRVQLQHEPTRQSSNVSNGSGGSASMAPLQRVPGRKIPLEIHMMRQFTATNTPGLIQYIEHFEVGPRFIIVMEYLGQDWIDLYDYIEMYGPVNEPHAREIFSQVVSAVTNMHRMGYCHNDIKDENIMIHTVTREIKLIDFGSTTRLEPGVATTVFYGTKKFAAPEAVQNKSYLPDSHEVWALGTLLYVILFKMDPFKSDEEVLGLDIERRIHRLRNPAYHGKNPASAIVISDAATMLLVALLQKDYRRRPVIEDIIGFEFFSPEH